MKHNQELIKNKILANQELIQLAYDNKILPILTTKFDKLQEKNLSITSVKDPQKISKLIQVFRTWAKVESFAYDVIDWLETADISKPTTKDPFQKIFVAKDKKNNILGVLLADIDPNKSINISRLITNPNKTSQGIGKSLMRHAGAQAEKHKIFNLTLESLPTATGFYERLNFICEYGNMYKMDTKKEINELSKLQLPFHLNLLEKKELANSIN